MLNNLQAVIPRLTPPIRVIQPLLSFPDVQDLLFVGSAYVDLVNMGPWTAANGQIWTSLVPAIPDQNFSATWTGGFDVQGPGNYTFCITSNGGFPGFALSIGKARVLDIPIPVLGKSGRACNTTHLVSGSQAVSSKAFFSSMLPVSLTYAGPDTGGVAVLF